MFSKLNYSFIIYFVFLLNSPLSAGNSSLVVFDIDECLITLDSNKAPASVHSLDLLKSYQKDHLVIGVTQNKLEHHAQIYNFLKRHDAVLGSSKHHIDFQYEGALYARGVLYAPNLAKRPDILKAFQTYMAGENCTFKELVTKNDTAECKPLYASSDAPLPNLQNLDKTVTSAPDKDVLIQQCLRVVFMKAAGHDVSDFWIYSYLPDALLTKAGLTEHCGLFCVSASTDLKAFGTPMALTTDQTEKVLKQSDVVFKETQKLCQSLYYAETREALQALESQLLQLETTHNFSKGLYVPDANPYAMATPDDAAGALIYADHNGAPHILLGKRTGEGTYCNLGGSANLRESFVDVAKREVMEESGGGFVFPDLLHAPSHDTIIMKPHGALKKYRTYLVKTNYVDPARILARIKTNPKYAQEYTEFIWVPVASLGKIGLYKPFAESLGLEPIKLWLKNITERKAIPATCTQSIVGASHLKPVKSVVKTPSHDGHNFAHWMAEAMIRKQKHVKPEVHKIDSAPSVSKNLLNLLVPGDEKFEDKTRSFLKKYRFQEHTDLITKIVEAETQQKGIVLYHGLQAELWFWYRVLSLIRHSLNNTDVQTDVLRSLDSHFEAFPDAGHLLNFIVKGADNYTEGFQRAGLSCNPTIFSNANSEGSFTLEYFLRSVSQMAPHNRAAILEGFLNSCHVDGHETIRKLKDIYAHVFPKGTGALLQLFLDPSIVNESCYLSRAMGKAFLDEKQQPVREALPQLQRLKSGTLTKVDDRLQVRLLLDLHKFPAGKIKVKDYFTVPVDLAAVDREILNTLQPIMVGITKGLVNDEASYGSNPPQVVRAIRRHTGISAAERREHTPDIIQTYLSGNVLKLHRLMKEMGPSWCNAHYQEPDRCEVVKLGAVEELRQLDALPELQQDVSVEAEKLLEGNACTIPEKIATYVAVAGLGPKRAVKIKAAFDHSLLNVEMNAPDLLKVIKGIAVVGDAYEAVFKACRNLYSLVFSANEAVECLRIVNDLGANRDPIIASAFACGLIGPADKFPQTNSWHVLPVVKKLGIKLQKVLTFAQPLFASKTYSYAKKAEILIAIHELGDDCDDLAQDVTHVIQKYCDNGDIIAPIFTAVKALGDDRKAVLNSMETHLKTIIYAYEDYIDTIRYPGAELAKVITAIHGLGKNREVLMKFAHAHKVLLYAETKDSVSECLNKLANLGPECVDIIEKATSFLQERDCYSSAIYKALDKIMALGKNRGVIFAKVNQLVCRKMTTDQLIDLVDTLVELGDQADVLITTALEAGLVQPQKYKDGGAHLLLLVIKNLGAKFPQVLKDAKPLVPYITSYNKMTDLLSKVDELGDQATAAVTATLPLKIDDKHGKDAVQLLSKVHKLGEDREEIVTICKPLVDGIKYTHGAEHLLMLVEQLGSERADIVETAMLMLPEELLDTSREMGIVFEAMKLLGPDRKAKVLAGIVKPQLVVK